MPDHDTHFSSSNAHDSGDGSNDQLAFTLGLDVCGMAPREEEGKLALHGESQARLIETARFLGHPIGHRVRVLTRSGLVLEGALEVEEMVANSGCRADAHLELRIGSVVFHADEIRDCLTLD